MAEEEEQPLPTIPGLFNLEGGISQLTFNKDYSMCALSKSDKTIYIYKVGKFEDFKTWTLQQTLDAHTQYISGLDWSAKSNRILSCSYDKAAIIWDNANNTWTPNYLVATTKLGYLFASWNDRGDKLITGTSEKKLFMGFFNATSGWWTGKNIKVHKSSVICAKIDPTSLFVISGSTDLKVYVTSCYEPTVDKQYLTKETQSLAQDLGTPVFKFDCTSWVNCVTWTPSGNLGFAASQNSNLVIVDYKKNKKEIIMLSHAPFQYLFPLNDTSFYGIGYDKEIYFYEKGAKSWELKKKVTQDPNNIKENTHIIPDIPGEEKKEEHVSFIFGPNKNKHLHSSDISVAVMKDKTILTGDITGFIKVWKL